MAKYFRGDGVNRDMKKLLALLSIALVTCVAGAQDIDFDKYFTY